jgi:hypothetical protein
MPTWNANPRRAALVLPLALGLVAGVVSCSWARFDDVSQDAPVLLLEKPDSVGSGFGSSVASAEVDGFYRVFVGAAPGHTGGAEFEIGTGQGASKDAARAGHCDVGCTLAKNAAAMPKAFLDNQPRTLCFAEGWDGTGIQVQCDAGKTAFLSRLDAPAGLILPEPGNQLALTSERPKRSGNAQPVVPLTPVVAAGATSLDTSSGSAWFYPAGSQDPTSLDPGPAGPTFGAALAILETKGKRWIAVGEPALSRVHVFDDTGALAHCFASSEPGFGRTLSAGFVTGGDANEELVVATDKEVWVIDGSLLEGAPASCATNVTPVVKLKCRTTADLDGCGGSRFGAALAVADLDQNGDGEVLVGAPGMAVRDESDAGAVFVFDVSAEHPDWLLEARFISSAESGDRLGASIAVVHQPDRDIFVAGAPGNGKAALFYCSKLLPGSKRGSRCK